MKQRGRRSVAALGLVPKTGDNVEELTPHGPPPPSDLNKRERELWLRITSSLPKGWFTPPDEPLLFAYVAAVARHEAITVRCRTAEATLEGSNGNEVVNPIFRLQDMLSRQIGSLATKLRLSQSSQTRDSSAVARRQRVYAATGGGPKPWDSDS